MNILGTEMLDLEQLIVELKPLGIKNGPAVSRLISKKNLPAVRIGKKNFFHKEAVKTWLKGG